MVYFNIKLLNCAVVSLWSTHREHTCNFSQISQRKYSQSTVFEEIRLADSTQGPEGNGKQGWKYSHSVYKISLISLFLVCY